MVRQQKKVLEDRVLPNRLGGALPVNEFELGDATIGLKVERPSGITRAERHVLDDLSVLQNVRKAEHDPQRMDRGVYLACHALERGGRGERLLLIAGRG